MGSLEKGGARVTLFVPRGADARLMVIENAPADFAWTLRPSLAFEGRDAAFVRTRTEGGALRAVNPRGGAPGMDFGAAFSCAAELAAEYAGRPVFEAHLPGGGTRVIACGFLDTDELRRLAEPERAFALLDETKKYWAELTGRLRIKTPLPELDHYMNGWAVYQTLACRLLARTSIYQSGGAFGFRDQLQDAVNLLLIDPRSRAGAFWTAALTSTRRATSCTGGTRANPTAACARAVLTTFSGFPGQSASTSERPGTPASE